MWTKEQTHEFLKRTRWFGSLPPELSTAIVDEAVIFNQPKNGRLYAQGDTSNGLHALLEGEVRLAVYVEESDDPVIFKSIGPGAWFGDAGLFGHHIRGAEATTARKSWLLRLPLSGYERIVAAEPRYYWHFGALVLASARALHRELVMGRMNASDRAAWALRELVRSHGKRTGESAKLDLTFSQGEIASLAGVSRQFLNEALADWQARGIVWRSGLALEIPSLAKLDALIPASLRRKGRT